ncbi:MAG: radical SAM protein [Chloroflexi bacterium]|nr:radical SAM protein [Chloroflexota bacterium]
MAKQHRLVAVHWELTYRCNETCAHCYLEASPPLGAIPGELTTVQAKQVVDQIAGIGALQMTFSGGEILVRRDFFEIAEYARRKRLAIRLMTNGILINPRLADCIAALHPTGVELSLYGADAATHDAITQRPRSFELTLRAFRLLRERGVHTVMKTPLMRENVRQLPALRALAANVGATFYYDPTITAKDNGDTSPVKHRLTYDDLVSLLRAEINADDFALAPLRDDTQNPCAIGSSSLVIDPYGAVFPCLQTRIPAGNLRDQSLKEIWDGALVFRELGALTWSELPICRTCELNRLCTRCHGMAREANGDLHAPSTIHCRDALARRQVLVEKKILPLDFPIPAHLQDYLFDVARHADFS